MPFKYHAEHRHHIPKPRYRVTNWAEYDAALQRRGSLTVWFTDEAVQAWRAEPRTTPGGRPAALLGPGDHHGALMLRTVFGLALRQTEGLIGSVIGLLGLDLAVPDHSTLSRRAKTLEVPPLRRTAFGSLHLLVDSTGLKLGGAGEWLVEKHGTSRRRSWRKLHIGVDADSGEIAAVAVDQEGYRQCRDGWRIGEPTRRDRLLLINAFAMALLTMFGAAGESLGMDRLLKSNTSKIRTQARRHALRTHPNHAGSQTISAHGPLRRDRIKMPFVQRTFRGHLK